MVRYSPDRGEFANTKHDLRKVRHPAITVVKQDEEKRTAIANLPQADIARPIVFGLLFGDAPAQPGVNQVRDPADCCQVGQISPVARRGDKGREQGMALG